MSLFSKNILPLLLSLAAALPAARAQTVNWAADIAPILYEHCVKCHRDGGIAGFSIIAAAPHMHLIGQSATCFARTLQGDTIPLIRINDTLDNDQNPSNPPQHVWQGEATTDKMTLAYFTYMLYQPDDENIILDSTLLSTSAQALPDARPAGPTLSPNPAADRL